MNNSAIMAITMLGGLLSATLSLLPLTAFSGLVFISFFAALPLFLIGLGIGLKPLYSAGLIATIVVSLLKGPVVGLEFFVFFALGPAYLVNRALLNRKKSSKEIIWYPSSLLLKDLTFASSIILLIGLGYYIYWIQEADVHTHIKNLLEPMGTAGQKREAEFILSKIFILLPGFLAFFWTMMMFLNGAIAQGLLISFKWNIRPTPSIETLETPKSFLIVLGVSIALSIVGIGYVELFGKNIAFVLIFPFFMVGLGLIHRWFQKTAFPGIGLTLFYFLLFFLTWPALFIILLGILKPWIEKPSPRN